MKVVIITGATRAFGSAAAKGLAKAGAREMLGLKGKDAVNF